MSLKVYPMLTLTTLSKHLFEKYHMDWPDNTACIQMMLV